MIYETKLAIVSKDESSITRQGSFDAELVGSKLPISVVMTSPIGINPTGSEYYSYAGMFGNPTVDTQILVKKIDDSGYWYFDSVPIVSQIIPDNKGGTNVTITSPQLGSLDSPGDAVDTYSHSKSPQNYGLISSQGNKLVLSDSRNKTDRELFAKLESKTGQRFLASPSTGITSLKNAEGDGIVLTSKEYKGKYGVRSIKTKVGGNLTNHTTNGDMTLKVGSGGRVCNITNEAFKDHNKAGIASDNDVGSINIESFENDITIRVNSKSSTPGRRIFIDARGSNGLVSVRAGKGGVEIFSDQDVDINCKGDFNVNCAGNINMNGEKIHLNPNFTFGKEQPTTNNKEDAEESVT